MTDGRRLTAAETQLAKKVFRWSLKYGEIRIYNKRYWAQFGKWVMTPNGNIYAPTDYEVDYSMPTVSYARRSLFIHELVHVWQYQLNVLSIPLSAIGANIANLGRYEKAYPYDLDTSKDLLDYTMEQQASIIEDYFRITEGRSPRHLPKTSGSPRTKAAYEAVLAKFLANPKYAEGYMNRYEE